ncbi:MAG: F0F1 ATP synthase subunit B [Lachnospiraceae bacterium]|jgi:F-type H+-transporting ATPase subunit b|nr:F0F1 ATP synthase subunit B [Lachnospiraceae bacterium]
MTRLFNLDPQLLQDSILLAISMFFLFLIMSYNLFNPARKFLEDRKARIRGELEDAANDKEAAAKLKAEYEEKIKSADKEVEAILAEARKKALANENKIIAEAKEEAARIIARANEEALLEQKRVADDMKQQMITVAAMMAQKVVSQQIDTSVQASLVDETLKEMGGSTWQS